MRKLLLQNKGLARKTVVFLSTLLLMKQGYSQMNKEDHDDVAYYFGLSIGSNTSSFHVIRDPSFLTNTNFNRIEVSGKTGIELGLSVTGRLNNHFEVRFAPKLIVGGSQTLTYSYSSTNANYVDGALNEETIKLPQTLLSMPFALKFKSDRIGNCRAYVFAGPKVDFNLSANAAEYKQAMLLVSTASAAYPPPNFRSSYFGYEAGMGISIYLPFAVISPEIRISNSLQNNHLRDASNPYSSIIDKIQSRMIAFSIHLEH